MEVYKRAKQKIFKEFNVNKWEDISATKYNAVQAFIEECLQRNYYTNEFKASS